MQTRLKAALALLIIAGWSATAFAQLDPLSFIKRVPPAVIVVFDTSLEMLQDGSGNFYDPGFYSATADPFVMSAFSNQTITSKTYRRIFQGFHYAASGYTATTIQTVNATWDPSNPLTSNATADTTTYFANTRWQMARNGLMAAISENNSITRWGLIRLRQDNPQWRSTPGGSSTGGNDCDKPVSVSDFNQMLYGDSTPCNAGGLGLYGTYAPKVNSASYNQSSAPSGTVMVTPAANTATSVYNIVAAQAGASNALIPAGKGFQSSGVDVPDRPLTYALTDAKAAVLSAMAADSAATRSCRNYVVVLITSGKNSGSNGYLSSNPVATKAAEFTSISGSGISNKHVPIYVVGVKVAAADEAELQTIANNTGGYYYNAQSESQVQAMVDLAVQNGYARQTDVDAGRPSEFVAVSPIVGTVDLDNAKDINGTALPDTVIHLHGDSSAAIVPQRSNVLVSAAFELPGFYGRLRAFRVYKPQTDSSASTGYKFVNDGTRLWPDLDGRPSLAGQARTPADPNTRNIYTYIPNGSGGGSMMAFTTANVATLATAMNLTTTAASTLITAVRAQPIGAIIGSTPAIMDPPSLDPAPDSDYGTSAATGTFAGDHATRRSLIFVGSNDGMMHAIDARTGYEVWAFIPYNLLPKLRTLYDGQSVEQYEYFVDSSPKVAEVKVGGAWRSLLLFGEGPGGLFYNCFDVTEAGMGVSPELDDLTAVNTLLTKFDTPSESITFKWSFPNYNHFDPTIKQTFTLSDGTAGNKITMWGDLSDAKGATYAEKTVGFTWSDPAVGPLISDRSVNGIIVASGYFPAIETSTLLSRGGASAPAAGNVMYLLNADTGALIGNATQTACSGTGCLSVGDVANSRKNALQADPTAAGAYASAVVVKAYIGDIDGKYWRFDFNSSGTLTKTLMADTGTPIYASSALLFVGSQDIYMFIATGSDILPPTTVGGTGVFKLYGFKDNTSSASTMFSVNLASVSNTGGLVTGERPSTSPTVAGDIVFFTTTTESASTPCSDFSANLYAITYDGSAAYDANGDGKISNSESNLVKTVSGRASAPFIVDQHLYFSTAGASGSSVQAFGDNQDFNNGVGQVGVRILSWREIR